METIGQTIKLSTKNKIFKKMSLSRDIHWECLMINILDITLHMSYECNPFVPAFQNTSAIYRESPCETQDGTTFTLGLGYESFWSDKTQWHISAESAKQLQQETAFS